MGESLNRGVDIRNVTPVAEIAEARYKRKERQLDEMYELDERGAKIFAQLPLELKSITEVQIAMRALNDLVQDWSRFANQELGITVADWSDYQDQREGSP